MNKNLTPKYNIAFRVDSSFNIGSGHVMRCITLAHALLKGMNANILFFCREYEGCIIDVIKNSGFDVISMEANVSPIKNDSTYQTWLGATQEEDAEHFITAANKQGVVKFDFIIADHYAISEVWETNVRDMTNGLAAIDDLANRKHFCDFIIDQNYFKNFEGRYNFLTNIECKKLLGPKFTLLREEFSDIKKKFPFFESRIPQKIITIFFGGTDPAGYTENALRGLLAKLDDSYSINVILGKSNPNIDHLKSYEQRYIQVTIYIQVSNMSDHIGQSILFVGAIGATTWERCICGTPGIVSSIAENQIQAAIDLHEISAHYYLGRAELLSDDDYGNAALKLLNSTKLLKQQYIASKALVSESGAREVSNQIRNFIIGMNKC